MHTTSHDEIDLSEFFIFEKPQPLSDDSQFVDGTSFSFVESNQYQPLSPHSITNQSYQPSLSPYSMIDERSLSPYYIHEQSYQQPLTPQFDDINCTYNAYGSTFDYLTPINYYNESMSPFNATSNSSYNDSGIGYFNSTPESLPEVNGQMVAVTKSIDPKKESKRSRKRKVSAIDSSDNTISPSVIKRPKKLDDVTTDIILDVAFQLFGEKSEAFMTQMEACKAMNPARGVSKLLIVGLILANFDGPCCNLNEVYHAVTFLFPGMNFDTTTWKNSVRNVLVNKTYFESVSGAEAGRADTPPPTNNPSPKNYYRLKDESSFSLICARYLLANTIDILQESSPYPLLINRLIEGNFPIFPINASQSFQQLVAPYYGKDSLLEHINYSCMLTTLRQHLGANALYKNGTAKKIK
uniref:Fork-head domain-containing protein n=1 Tax=Rhabditophanes sp. KR3021 TaxID=114890 RepID=A0AC35U9Y0_9BILA